MAVNNVVDLLKNELTPDIARQNRFEVVINIDTSKVGTVTDNDNAVLEVSADMIKTATIPRLVVKTIEVRRAGKKIHYPGGIDYENLFLTFHNDVNGTIRNFFHQWQKKYYGDFGDGDDAEKDQSSLMKSGKIDVYQLDGNNTRKTKHTFEHCFPIILADIEFGHDNEDSLSSFNITFSFNKQSFRQI